MLIHVPRVLWTIARGALLRPQPLAGLGKPHVYTARSKYALARESLHMNVRCG